MDERARTAPQVHRVYISHHACARAWQKPSIRTYMRVYYGLQAALTAMDGDQCSVRSFKGDKGPVGVGSIFFAPQWLSDCVL
jgi:hypothetical protein